MTAREYALNIAEGCIYDDGRFTSFSRGHIRSIIENAFNAGAQTERAAWEDVRRSAQAIVDHFASKPGGSDV